MSFPVESAKPAPDLALQLERARQILTAPNDRTAHPVEVYRFNEDYETLRWFVLPQDLIA